MPDSTTLATTKGRFGAAYSVEQHLRRHGASLCNLLDALDDETGFSAFCDLHNAIGRLVPDADAIESAVLDIHRIFGDQPPSTLDRIGFERKLPASDMTRWLGARVSEFLARFRRAK